MKYIYHHMGLGDHIICNGLVREYRKLHGRVGLFCKCANAASVSRMYRDDAGIEIIALDTDKDVEAYIERCGLRSSVSCIGFARLHDALHRSTFDQLFYEIAGVPFAKRWESFFLARDSEAESVARRMLNPEGRPFALIHGSDSHNVDRIDYSQVRADLLPIHCVRLNFTGSTLFDYCGLIEDAEEVHCQDSSLIHLVESLQPRGRLFYHKDIVPKPGGSYDFKMRHPWRVIRSRNAR